MKKLFALILMIVLIAIAGAAAANRAPILISETNAAPRTAAVIYAKECATCHGRDGRAKTMKAKFNHARDLTDAQWQESVSDERIFNSISNGKGKKMPAFGKKISEAEIDALVRYVRGLKK